MSTSSDLPRIAAPAQRALQSAGITNLKQLAKFTEAEIPSFTKWDRMRCGNCVTHYK